jgi:hypothetical protein
MRAANVFQGASQGIKTMDGHPKNIVCPSQGIKTMDGQPKKHSLSHQVVVGVGGGPLNLMATSKHPVYVSALMRSPFATLPALPFFALARGVDRGW